MPEFLNAYQSGYESPQSIPISQQRIRKARRVLIVALVLAIVWPLLAWGAARWLIVRAELSHADVIAVLAGSATYIERARTAAALFRDGRASRVILTNDNLKGSWSEPEERNLLFVERAAEELRHFGVPADRIEILQPPVTSTFDEATVLREYAATHQIRLLLVVTSGYHSRRALWTLRHVFRKSAVTIGLDPVEPGQQTPSPSTWWWHKLGWKMVPGEYFKLIYYWFHYA
jgi:uncharacterized SAM-binding protein YcdF (DUF218 family)